MTWVLVVIVLTSIGLETYRQDIPVGSLEDCRAKREQVLNAQVPDGMIPVGVVCVHPVEKGLRS